MNGVMSQPPPARVLIADDDDTSRTCLCKLLRFLGYDCAAAPDGEAALRLARSFRPQVILMDLRMPVLDGLEATRQLKADQATRGIPVWAFTSSTTREDRQEARRAGFDDFLAKAADFDQLILQLRRHLPAAKVG